MAAAEEVTSGKEATRRERISVDTDEEERRFERT